MRTTTAARRRRARVALLPPLLLLLHLVLIDGLQAAFGQPTTAFSCADGKLWNCEARLLRFDEAAPILQHVNHTTDAQDQTFRKNGDFYGTYLNKMNPLDGSFYVSARIKLEIRQAYLRNATGIFLRVQPSNKPSEAGTFYQARLKLKRPIPELYTVDFLFNIEDVLQYEQEYLLELHLLPASLGIAAKHKLNVTSYVVPEVDCDSAAVETAQRQREASRWTTVISDFSYYTLLGVANITFYGAPKSYCIDSYEVQLYLAGAAVVESHVVRWADMVEVDGKMMGNVTLTKVIGGQNYTASIIPFNSREKCVCKNILNCACVTVFSGEYNFPASRTFSELLKNHEDESGRNQQLLLPSAPDSTRSDTSVMVVIILVLSTSLGIVSVLLALIVWQNKSKRDMFVVLKPSANNEPLLPNYIKPVAHTVLLLNAEPIKDHLLNRFVQILEHNNAKVIFPARETHEIEQNVIMWCTRAVQQADKIMLLHSQRAIDIMAKRNCVHALLDNVTLAVLAMVPFSDPKIIHSCWESAQVRMFPYVETMFCIPRDMGYLGMIITGQNIADEVAKEFREEYEYWCGFETQMSAPPTYSACQEITSSLEDYPSLSVNSIGSGESETPIESADHTVEESGSASSSDSAHQHSIENDVLLGRTRVPQRQQIVDDSGVIA